jgi:SAM-dependent methyltransferase
MDNDAIREHWRDWAVTYATSLRATTKTPTIKELELHALAKAIRSIPLTAGTVLEVGCGNGINCLALAEMFSDLRFAGVDYIPEMIENARAQLEANPRLAGHVAFHVGDVLEVGLDGVLDPRYDLVFTDRMLVNLNTWELQAQALDTLLDRVAPGGHLVMIENFVGAHTRLNDLREAVDLPRRPAAPFNRFIEEDRLEHQLEDRAQLIAVETFGSLHDVILYVLTPLVGDGEIDYAHPMVRAATDLCLAAEPFEQGEGGQNRIYLFRRNV